MTEDEMQRKMEFILEQQAQFAADMQQMQEKQKVLTDSILTVVGIVGKLTVAQEHTWAALERTDAKLSERDAKFSERMDRLAEAQANTDERLNALIGIVERYFSDGRDGKSQA